MRSVIISLLLCSCTTAQSAPQNLWPDFDCAWGAMKRATRESYSSTVTRALFENTHLSVELGEPAAGLTWLDGRVWVRRAENRTLDSVLAHEIWEHRLPFVLMGDLNAFHTLRWLTNRHRLHSRAWVLTVECLQPPVQQAPVKGKTTAWQTN